MSGLYGQEDFYTLPLISLDHFHNILLVGPLYDTTPMPVCSELWLNNVPSLNKYTYISILMNFWNFNCMYVFEFV
jgi:hypothetical protein